VRAATLVLQLLLSLVLVAVTAPAMLATFPATQGATLGPALVLVALVAVFGVLRWVWPKPKA
jgi:hypothetical protein